MLLAYQAWRHPGWRTQGALALLALLALLAWKQPGLAGPDLLGPHLLPSCYRCLPLLPPPQAVSVSKRQTVENV